MSTPGRTGRARGFVDSGPGGSVEARSRPHRFPGGTGSSSHRSRYSATASGSSHCYRHRGLEEPITHRRSRSRLLRHRAGGRPLQANATTIWQVTGFRSPVLRRVCSANSYVPSKGYETVCGSKPNVSLVVQLVTRGNGMGKKPRAPKSRRRDCIDLLAGSFVHIVAAGTINHGPSVRIFTGPRVFHQMHGRQSSTFFVAAGKRVPLLDDWRIGDQSQTPDHEECAGSNRSPSAKEAVKEAERCDPSSIFTQFSVYKIAVLEGNTEKAVEAIVAMGKLAAKPAQHEDKLLADGSAATSLLSLAAQIALENEQQAVAIKALEYLSQHSQDCQQVFTALKCLVRLVLSKVTAEPKENRTKDMDTLLTYLTSAHRRLAESFTKRSMTLDMRTREAHWFRKMAWNLAVQFENCPGTMRDFFVLSFKLSQFCPSDKAVLIAQKTCLLLAAAVDLEMGRCSLTLTEQIELLSQALHHIQACREIWNVLKLTGDFSKDPTDTLLLLYEFEARAKLNDPELDSLLELVWELPQIETKTLETIACKGSVYISTVLKVIKCLHSLVHLSLPTGVIDTDACILEEVWGYFEDALSVVGTTDDYPEVETLWLMTRAWNTGILQYSVGKYKEAEQWCGLGVRFLNHLRSLKSSYESQMIGLYSEVLDKLDRAKGFLPNEE
nr:testis-expressed protein 11 [Chelonoidis abingdonii]